MEKHFPWKDTLITDSQDGYLNSENTSNLKNLLPWPLELVMQ